MVQALLFSDVALKIQVVRLKWDSVHSYTLTTQFCVHYMLAIYTKIIKICKIQIDVYPGADPGRGLRDLPPLFLPLATVLTAWCNILNERASW